MTQWKQLLVTPTSSLEILSLDDILSAEEIKTLWETPVEKDREFVLYGKTCKMHRGMAFFSNESRGYSFSNQIIDAQPLMPLHEKLLKIVHERTGEIFNGLLFNLYFSGEDYISAHSDKEMELSNVGVVALSFGCGRTFRIRSKTMKGIVLDHVTGNNELLWMKGQFQHEFTHEIPKELRLAQPRLSITFRYHQN